MAHLITSVQNVLESPNVNIDIIVPIIPIISTGFRPTLSDKRLHWNTVSASVAKNKDSYESMLAAHFQKGCSCSRSCRHNIRFSSCRHRLCRACSQAIQRRHSIRINRIFEGGDDHENRVQAYFVDKWVDRLAADRFANGTE